VSYWITELHGLAWAEVGLFEAFDEMLLILFLLCSLAVDIVGSILCIDDYYYGEFNVPASHILLHGT
jgi:hypothetical protein